MTANERIGDRSPDPPGDASRASLYYLSALTDQPLAVYLAEVDDWGKLVRVLSESSAGHDVPTPEDVRRRGPSRWRLICDGGAGFRRAVSPGGG